jgi:hypothetical protein
MHNDVFAKLIFLFPFDERDQSESHDRGYLSHVLVELRDGKRYPVIFYDPVRLSQDIDEYFRLGWRCVAAPGVIVVPEVTLPHMEVAAQQAAREGLFTHLKEIDTIESASMSPEWPPIRT